MEKLRKPFQGTWNIIRFNWQFYFIAGLAVVFLFLLRNIWNEPFFYFVIVLIILIIATTFLSLIVSFYIYDLSGLYKLNWLNKLVYRENEKILNIHAGFDETSALLHKKFISSTLTVFDFYDPVKHTEISIKRARKAYPPFPGTVAISTGIIPMEKNSTDKIFLILSAHEIRDADERVVFFKELYSFLNSSGKIIVTEHLRDLSNFLAYNIGFFHFHSKKTWKQTFKRSELVILQEIKVTPFITTFILGKNGITS